MESPEHQARAVREYMELECPEEVITHLEKVASERIFDTKYETWDVHTDRGRWWVITEPMNLYSQADFKGMDFALTFHIGLGTRIHSRQRTPTSEDEAARFPQTVRRWESAAQALQGAEEAEEFQAVGMRCRECLLALIRESSLDRLSPSDLTPLKRGDFVAWSGLIADGVLSGGSNERLRAYSKVVAKASWELVSWLTHAAGATRTDAQIALDATGNVIAVFVSAVRRWERGTPEKCPKCGSYQVIADFRRALFDDGVDDPYVKLCEACGWEGS